MKKINIIWLAICMLLCVGCSDKISDNQIVQTTEEELGEMFATSQPSKKSLGQYGFGVQDVMLEKVNSRNMIQVEYNGEEIHIPYYVQGMGKGDVADFALMLWVNGVPHSFWIEYADGKSEKESFMQPFQLEGLERREFDVVFKPHSGKKGDRISFVFGTVLKPDYMVESVEHPNFGNYLHLSANTPFELKLNADVEELYIGTNPFKEQDITQEIIDKKKNILHSSSLDSLDQNVILNIYDSETKDPQIVYIKDNCAKVDFELLGGADVSHRITFYVNHKLVKVNGADYLTVKTRKGKMYCAEVELELEEHQKLNSLYAVSMTDGEDYYVQDIRQSRIRLLAERGE